MSRKHVFGWDLPPGCTNADIEHHFGDQPLIDEIFGTQGGLSLEQQKTWEKLCEEHNELIVKALEWAMQSGRNEQIAVEQEASFHMFQHLRERINKEVSYKPSRGIALEIIDSIESGKEGDTP